MGNPVAQYILPNVRYRGYASNFGGPRDIGVAEREGLALYEQEDADKHPELFLPHFVTIGGVAVNVARRLMPGAAYCACRWDYGAIPKELLRKSKVLVQRVDDISRAAIVAPVDWGPSEDTGRIIDLSPGIFKALDLSENTSECEGTEVWVTLQVPSARWSELQPIHGES